MSVITEFKFRKIDKRLIESLVNAEVYFSVPDKLNDPFDCKIDIGKSFDRAISKSKGTGKIVLEGFRTTSADFFLRVEKSIKGYGVWSCSNTRVNPLAWVHYGDEHRGLCLTYELPDTFVNQTLGEVIGVFVVDYNQNLFSEWLIENAKTFKQKLVEEDHAIDNFTANLVIKLLTSKDKCWEHEDEVRVISLQPGIKIIGKAALTEVCFGLKTSQKDRDLIEKILDKHGYEVEILEMGRDDNDFGLRVIDSANDQVSVQRSGQKMD